MMTAMLVIPDTRSRLKQRILDLYPDDLLFLIIDGKTPQIVVSRERITTTSTTNTKEYLLKAAAKALHSEILEYEKSLPDLSWPPQIDVLKERNESIPSMGTNFLDILLKAPGHSNSVFTQRLIDSFSQDLVHGVSRGRVITLKHFALGVGMHNITGQKFPARILYSLGYCIDYESVCQSETAEAEIARQLYEEGMSPGLQPKTEEDSVLTHFWADNFNKKVESDTGKDMINSTHLVKFQEVSPGSEYQSAERSVPKTLTRFKSSQEQQIHDVRINPKEEPEKLTELEDAALTNTSDISHFDLRYFCGNFFGKFLLVNKPSRHFFAGNY